MELDLNVKGDSPQEILAKLAEYLSNAIGHPGGLEKASENVPGVTANAGGGGGP